MTKWIDVAPVNEFDLNAFQSITMDGVQIAVFNLNGEFYAIEDACTHAHKTLTGGEVDADRITCPWHGARFNIKTGEALTAPAYEAVATFPTRIEKEMVQVEWDDE
uniref:3-phenylpropionate/trans-cinnamate dioxygenase ferredoxin subunit n=1 Tax=Candidatus Kentrum sp. TUN TaxID=2126343 RepID=A0A450ZKT3_9GAMM|nr:MAG: 3-phenylpropionate/trans-cinnamate dioxygenase ferredoxin subunit [Candidatus Kentron sp. TUN]VFK53405.1 MAG: 3-phenylpropionate/trans-cinnamate dioxygenase ferredoxin subunit [Candidatus Kentron sp. TUN]VFK54370.1 MAG: 3-phenylpropionate/trans-cinnamate dioxygenase ferredoxin subunit [Candidatus Kentron sp. TUN]